VADDLSAPLGQDTKPKKRLALPIRMPHALAGVLGLCVLVFAGWVVLAEDPLGGEPMVVVSADARPPAQGGKSAEPASSPTPVTEVTAEKSAAPAGKTITIIDGMSGKRQEVPIGPGDAKAPAIEQRMIESSRHGTLPKIAADGARPADAYARPVQLSFDKVSGPRVAIVLGGLGIGSAGTYEALGKLPAPVTLAFAPYGTDLGRWVARARGEGHEVLLQVPMEPFDYPDNDPGPQTLLTTLTAAQNIDRLHWFMSRFQGYIGIANYMGARFTANEAAVEPLLRETGKRGLIYFDDGSSARSAAGQIAGATNVPFAKADVVLDAAPTQAAIDAALARLEATARERGSAIGTATALPASIERIATWAKAAQNRGIILVPISMLAIKPKST